MSASTSTIEFSAIEPANTVMFHDAKGQLIGTFDFSQSPATFTGDVDASAKLFVELVIATFNKAVPQ